MSVQKATKTKVAEAMSVLRKLDGETPTLEQIRTYIGGGSPETIATLRREVEKDELAAQDPPELLASFRTFYNSIRQQGSAARQNEIEKLTSEVASLATERDAAILRFREHRDKNEAAQTEIVALKDDLTKALKDAKAISEKLESLRDELGATKDRLHVTALEIAALKTLSKQVA